MSTAQHPTPPETPTVKTGRGLRQGLSHRHIQFIALGSAIGTGLFYGSAEAIQSAGPLVLVAYAVAGAAVFLVMRALGEMAVREPLPGSFGAYAKKYLGRFAGFVTGWTFVFEMVVVAIADVTAFAVYMGFWFPDTPRWIWVAAVILFIAAVNTRHVKVFGELEFWLSLIKVLAILAMVVGGVVLLVIGMSQGEAGVGNLVDHGGFAPEGGAALLPALAVVVFAFGGVETIGITAGEAKDPHTSIPRAVNTVPARVLLFYVAALAVIMSLIPWNQIDGESSPFVQIFTQLGIPAAAHVLNVVVIAAAVSAINADTYGAGRVLYGLAKQRQAPQIFARTSSSGVPWMAAALMCAALAVGAVLNHLIPERVFTVIASLATFATVWVWLMIVLSHLASRRLVARGELSPSPFKQLFGSVGSWIAVAFIGLVIVLLGVFEDTRVALYVGIAWMVLLAVVYWLTPGLRSDRTEHHAGPANSGRSGRD